MGDPAQFLNPSEAAKRLGVSRKALRLYEERGLIAPLRTAVGWRTYGPADMARGAEIVGLRALGLSLAQVARVLEGDPECLGPALAAHQAALEGRVRQLTDTVEKVRNLRADLARGQAPTAGDLARMVRSNATISVTFDLPWPWGGEKFVLNDIRLLNYIIGPLGSGKTRLASTIANSLPEGVFLGLERLAEGGAAARAQMDRDPALKARVGQAMAWLVEEGAIESAALIALVVAMESRKSAVLVIDMLEQGLDQASQEALIGYLRHHAAGGSPLFLITRSSAILDMTTMGPDEAIILCPANHSPPTQVPPYPGAAGYEAVATCLASPEVRARTEGVIACLPHRAEGGF